MYVYLASGFNRRRTLQIVEKLMEDRGIYNTASWIHLTDRPSRADDDWPQFAREIALKNMDDLARAEAVYVDTAGIRVDNGGGVHTELGYALGKGLPVYIIGKPSKNSFQHLPESFGLKTYESWEDYLIDVLEYDTTQIGTILSVKGIYLGATV